MDIKTISIHLSLCLLLLNPEFSKAATPVINDSLVEGLDCRLLSSAEIFKKIRPTAFSSSYHLPIKNWTFSAGLYDLAACWSMARTQRLFFYLARWEDAPSPNSDKTLFDLLEMIRGTSPYAHTSDSQIKEFPLSEYYIFPQRENTWDVSSPLWHSLIAGITQDFPNDKTLKRTFKSEVEFYQNRRFHDFIRNIRYIIGDGARSPEKNRATRDQILKNIENNRLPLILLRPKRVSQHVVIAKKFEISSNGDIEIRVYDSNAPLKDQLITFSKADNEFYAPDIVRGLPEISDPQAALGVFIVDDNEFKLIDKALLSYYQKKCGF